MAFSQSMILDDQVSSFNTMVILSGILSCPWVIHQTSSCAYSLVGEWLSQPCMFSLSLPIPPHTGERDFLQTSPCQGSLSFVRPSTTSGWHLSLVFPGPYILMSCGTNCGRCYVNVTTFIPGISVGDAVTILRQTSTTLPHLFLLYAAQTIMIPC
jgi:hypothetical protein